MKTITSKTLLAFVTISFRIAVSLLILLIFYFILFSKRKIQYGNSALYDKPLRFTPKRLPTDINDSMAFFYRIGKSVPENGDTTQIQIWRGYSYNKTFYYSNLSNRQYYMCPFKEVYFYGTNLSNSCFYNCYFFDYVYFEPATLPDIECISTCIGLDNLRYLRNPSALIQLKKEMLDKGFNEAAKKIEASLKRSEYLKSNRFTTALNYLLFDLTYAYGSDKGRPLLIYLYSILFFALIYWNLNGKFKDSTILIIKKQPPREYKRRIYFVNTNMKIKKYILTEAQYLSNSLIFSFSKSLRLGFGIFDFSKWIQMMQVREYTFNETNYLRPITGVQSLISLFLIFLWISATFLEK
jgi:hypothetical protein